METNTEKELLAKLLVNGYIESDLRFAFDKLEYTPLYDKEKLLRSLENLGRSDLYKESKMEKFHSVLLSWILGDIEDKDVLKRTGEIFEFEKTRSHNRLLDVLKEQCLFCWALLQIKQQVKNESSAV
jgi:hypothetical protein